MDTYLFLLNISTPHASKETVKEQNRWLEMYAMKVKGDPDSLVN